MHLPNDPFTESLGYCLRFGVYLQFFINTAEVKADGVYRDTQFSSRGLMIVAFYEQLQYPDFMRCQAIVCILRRSDFPEKRNNPLGYVGSHGRASLYGLL
jgi:hypothetical protein